MRKKRSVDLSDNGFVAALLSIECEKRALLLLSDFQISSWCKTVFIEEENEQLFPVGLKCLRFASLVYPGE